MFARFISRTVALAAGMLAAAAVFQGAGSGDDGFRWPLDLPRGLSGTLGETRGFPLHMGIDLKTDGLNGYPVYASMDGALSRLASSPKGYGNALFLDHGDGITTVYAHLDRFTDTTHPLEALSSLASALYTPDPVNMLFTKQRLLFSRGEIIGFSGESGSGPPHLHYEVRGASGFENPLHFHRVPDRQRPVIDALYLCVEKDGSTVWERRVGVNKRLGRYAPAENPLVYPDGGRPFLKVSCYDRVNADNSVGVYRISLSSGEIPCLDMVFDRIGFDEYRDGSLVYDLSKSGIEGSVSYTYRLRRVEGAPPWVRAQDGGFLTPERPYRLEVRDHAGNSAVLDFRISPGGERVGTEDFVAADGSGPKLLPDRTGRFSLELPGGALDGRRLLRVSAAGPAVFDDLPEDHHLKKGDLEILGAWVAEPFDLVFRKPVRLGVKGPPPVPGKPRAFIYLWLPGKGPRPLWTRYDAAARRYTAETRAGGYFLLAVDRGAPEVYLPPVQDFIVEDGPRLKLRVIAHDALSRVDSGAVSCFFDGEELPARYDHDRRWIELDLPRETLAAGFHQLTVFCADYAGNRTVFRTLLKR